MKLFCAKCQTETTNNIEVYENVDGVLVHCGECNFPLMFVGYDEPNWFGNDGKLSYVFTGEEGMREEQLELFDEGAKCDCDYCSEKINEEQYNEYDPTDRIAFTNDDLNLMERTIIFKVSKLRKQLDNASELLDKLQTLQGLREC